MKQALVNVNSVKISHRKYKQYMSSYDMRCTKLTKNDEYNYLYIVLKLSKRIRFEMYKDTEVNSKSSL